MATTKKRSRPAGKSNAGAEPFGAPRKVEGTSIMDLCGVGRKYAPKKPVTVAEMKRAVLDEAAARNRGKGRGRR